MGKAPKWIDKANFVVDFVDNPCDAPWTVYFETALPAAGRAVLMVLAFGMDDVIRGYARPGGRRNPYHRRKGRKGRLRIRGIPELGEAVGSHLPAPESFKTRSVTQGVKNLWIVDGVMQRALWYWLLADIISEFLYEWTTTISKTEFCKGRFGSNLLAEGAGGSAIAIVGWMAILLPNVRYETGTTAWNVASGSIGPGLFNIALGLKFKNLWFDQAEILIGIFKNPVFSAAYDVSDSQLIPGFGTGEAMAQAQVRGPATFSIGWRTSVGTATGTEGFISVVQIGE